MNRWLVIGDSSFTGTAFCKLLTDQGEQVAGISLRDGEAVEALGKPIWGEWDYVVNFAAANVVADSWKYPQDYFRVNVLEQIPLWDAMVKSPPRKYVHISTPEVYGSTQSTITEHFNFRPSTPYATSRAAAELLLLNYVSQYKLPVVITRAANVYGEDQQLYRLIPKLAHTILSGGKFSLEGGGKSIRGFIHVNDCCRAIETIAYRGTVGEAYHIAPAETAWIQDIVQMVCNKMEARYRDVVDITEDRPGKDMVYSLDASKLRALGWFPVIPLEAGIERVTKWIKRDWDRLQRQPTVFEFVP
jgi:dTDP-glucose 4,6-dehydratase